VKDVVVRSDARSVARVRHVAGVNDGVVPQWVRVVEDGKNAVLFQVYEQPDGNAVQIAAAVRDRLASFKWPDGVNVANWYDQSTLVVESAGSVRDAVLIGLALSGMILFLFLRSWRVILVALLAVPATLLTTMLLLQVTGQSFNIMTLGGIAAAVGLIIDDVIVMVEQISRRASARGPQEESTRGRDAVLPAAQEFLRPLTGSSLATMIVFLPLAFLSGVTGAFSKTLSITMAAALAISWLMVAFVVPVLSRSLINYKTWTDPTADRVGWYARAHSKLLSGLFRRPWLLAALLGPILVLGTISYQQVPTGFMPKADEGGFIIDYHTLPGTSLAETDREIRQVEDILKAMPEVATFSRRTGLGLGGIDFSEPNDGDFFVRLKPASERRPIEQIMAEVRSDIQAKVPGINVSLAQLMEDLIGDLTAVPQPIEIQIFADDPAKLIAVATKVGDAIAAIPGVVEMNNGIVLAGDALNVTVDPVKASLEGMTTAEVSAQVNDYLNGNVATKLAQTLKSVGVRVSLDPSMHRHEDDLAQLPIRASDGHLVPLGRIATLTKEIGQPEIKRRNLQQMLAVTARIENRDLASTIADIHTELSKAGIIPPGVRYELGGLYRQQQIAFAGLAKVFAAALMAELILLVFLYKNLRLPLVIIGTSLLSTTAVFMVLWVTGVELNITALMGMTMIIGISSEMAIFYVSEFTELAHRMPQLEALREAARNRLRPISMTTLATVLTLLPLALAMGPGSATQQPLALSIIAGLLLQFPTVLLAMPVLLALTMRRDARAPITVPQPVPAQ
jgi:multidrug efflux pump subunit AcrB